MSKNEKKNQVVRIVLTVLIAVIAVSLITALIVKLTKRNELPERVSVTWILDGKKAKTEKEAYLYGEKIETPFEPELAENTAVDGWYSDNECTKAFSFSTKLKKDLTLYGRTVYDDPNLWYLVGEGEGTLNDIHGEAGLYLLEQDPHASDADYSIFRAELELYAGDKFHVQKGREAEGTLGYTELIEGKGFFESTEQNEISLKEKCDGLYRLTVKIYKKPDATHKNSIALETIKALKPIPLATYTVTFNLGSYTGNEKVAPMSVKEGQEIILPDAPQWSGHTFLHWAAGENTYNAGAHIVVYGNGTLTAVWNTDDA